MTDQGMEDGVLRQQWNRFEKFVESGGEGGCLALAGPLSALLAHFGDNFYDEVLNFQGSSNQYRPGEFGQKYVDALNSRYADNQSMKGFLQNLAELSGSDSIDNFFGLVHPRTYKLGIGNEKVYKGAGDIGKRIREATRCRSQSNPPPATPRRGGAGSVEGEAEASWYHCSFVPIHSTNIAHSFSIHRPSSSVHVRGHTHVHV